MKPEENDTATDTPTQASSAAQLQGGQNEDAKTAQDVENEVAKSVENVFVRPVGLRRARTT